jgi:hypothetical protein
LKRGRFVTLAEPRAMASFPLIVGEKIFLCIFLSKLSFSLMIGPTPSGTILDDSHSIHAALRESTSHGREMK